MSDSFSQALSAVTEALSNPPSPENIKIETAMQLLGAMDKLRAMLEPPNLAVVKLCTAPYALSCTRVAQGMGVFNAFLGADGSKGMTLEELDGKTKGDKELLFRVMRHLSALDLFTKVDGEKYQPSALALQLADGSPVGDCIKHFYLNMRATSFLNEYFEERGYANPSDAYDSPFQYAHGTKEHFFQWLGHNPADQEAFNSVMTMNRQMGEAQWFDIFPVEERLQVPADRALIVDIGGGVGHDMVKLKEKFPSLSGKYVVQDLPGVIGDIKTPLPDGIDATVYNMFESQPVKGAKAYYMRTVLHDWPDKQALEALARIREAMVEDSILLINEFTMSDSDVSRISTAIDQDMMEAFSSLDRTEKQWISLLERGGFEIVKVWKFENNPGVAKALYEAVPKI
ncbi:O-methyltransferase [Penicillium angulare]|uniref:O-methyltransferase n=1 Tax=Penicillium angulare TaxID=116970 RepID=A0A9W9FTZ2_9EURO|nr:O-methyltransferase [Penicillium angulare]